MEKSVLVLYTRKRNFEGLVSQRTKTQKYNCNDKQSRYLGMLLEFKLGWNRHMDKIIKKSEVRFFRKPTNEW